MRLAQEAYQTAAKNLATNLAYFSPTINNHDVYQTVLFPGIIKCRI